VVELERQGGASRAFGLFELDPQEGVPAQLGFAPQSLEVSGLSVTIWGVPWGACEGALSFTASASAWGGGGEAFAEATNRDQAGNPALQEGCNSLVFEPQPLGGCT
jgi:hypothetical protein